jgi:hypothetical protein
MPVLGRVALAAAVVVGGVALGAMLGTVADPAMKMAERPWHDPLQTPVAADVGYLAVEAPPRNFGPYQDSYAPAWADEEMTDLEPDYPAWTYTEPADAGFADAAPAEEAPIEQRPAATPEVALASEKSEPVVPADLAPGPPPAGAASYRRVAAHLGDIY